MGNSKDILLISPPWASLEQPSLAFGIVKSLLKQVGLDAEVRYLNLEFAEEVGVNLYRSLKDRDVMVCEWIFSEALFGNFSDRRAFLKYLRTLGYSEQLIGQWAKVQSAAAPFIKRCADSIDWPRYKVVGFTTTMIQSLSSLALAKLARERNPELRIVFGGANCEGEMGAAMIDNFPFIDVVVRRDSDAFVGELFACLREGKSIAGLPVCYRQGDRVFTSEMPQVFSNLDSNPFPDYDDYFDQLAASSFRDEIRVNIVFEGSRGCWYGEKVPCTFCAVCGSSMEYRAKSAPRLVDELAYLADRHKVSWFGAADNILDNHSHMELCRMISERIPDAKIFFDVKANLTRTQLQAMKKAGIDEIQPGIESFSSRVLKLMQKGTTGIRNVHVLRMCGELGIWAMWNYLYGFPGETVEDYLPLLDKISPALFHLPAPYVGFGLSMMRFSEYFKKPEKLGVRITGPLTHYQYIYDLPADQINRLAYYFEYDYMDGYSSSFVGERVKKLAEEWNHAYYIRKVELTGRVEADSLVIYDTRFGRPKIHRLEGLDAVVYRLLECTVNFRQLSQRICNKEPALYLRGKGNGGVAAAVARLEREQLIYREGDRYTALAIPEHPDAFWGLSSEIEVPTDNTLHPLPSLLHWKVDHLYT